MKCGRDNNIKRMKKYCIAIGLLFVNALYCFGQDEFAIVAPLEEKWQRLPFNGVRPAGWLLQQLKDNVKGFVGHLDALAPDLIREDDIYFKDRLTKQSKPKELGALGGEGDWRVQLFWWNSETQSNWRDGYIRSAILSNQKKYINRAGKYVSRILKTQDRDGYLGIYAPELRYNFDNENGELWAKASVLRGLLAWYAYSKDERVLKAVVDAVQNTMDHYPINQSHPFASKNPSVSGLSHGLTFTDVLEQLYYLKKDQRYLQYALFLYRDFSEHTLNEDAQFKKAIQPELPLYGHGVHSYEHLRSLAAAYYASGNERLLQALQTYEDKIKKTTTVSGGPVGDEWIGGRPADATTRGYEYCSLHELLHSYASLLAKTGEARYAEAIEHLFFNAAQGARHPDKSAIAYLKSDNSYSMTGGLNGDTSDVHQTRYRYSPVHKEAAVCCVPNAGRIAPYYIEHMWMKTSTALVASLLGPSVVHAEFNGQPVKVQEVTRYPFANDIEFIVEAPSVFFTLKIRIPEWARSFTVNFPYTQEDGYISIAREWKAKDKVQVSFLAELATKKDTKGDYYFQYGPLLLAHPIEALETITKTYSKKNLEDAQYTPVSPVVYTYLDNQAIVAGEDLSFTTTMWNPKTAQPEAVRLVPFGQTLLRQTTFKKKE